MKRCRTAISSLGWAVVFGACAALSGTAIAAGQPVLIPGGSFVPQYGSATPGEEVLVASFRIDPRPVTNRQFAMFVRKHPEWRVGAPAAVLADEQYLQHWPDREPGPGQFEQPAIFVSWFAAHDYCVAAGGRLPTTMEWEFVAAASSKKPDATRDSEFIDQILKWYSAPSRPESLSPVGQGPANYWGLYDLHGLVWEWTADFNSVFVIGDSRRDGDSVKNMFCGDAATGSADRGNYAAFMRYALRSSLLAKYTTANVGFRCAYEKAK